MSNVRGLHTRLTHDYLRAKYREFAERIDEIREMNSRCIGLLNEETAVMGKKYTLLKELPYLEGMDNPEYIALQEEQARLKQERQQLQALRLELLDRVSAEQKTFREIWR